MAHIRLFVEAALAERAELVIDERRSHYLLNVMRRRAGDLVALFNGRDGEWQAEVGETRRRTCVLRVRELLRRQVPEPGPALLFAPLKRGPMEIVVEKATELGVLRLEPVLMQRSAVTAVNLARLHAIAVEAAEQSRRLSLPELLSLRPLDQALAERPPGAPLYVADETGEGRPALEALDAGPGDLLIGPEGGFAPEELEHLRGRDEVVAIDLGPRVLRAETAAIVALALWQARFGA